MIYPELKNNSWFFAGVLLVCFLFSVVVRYQQFETWEKTPATYFVGERPMMTTLDAPYWLRWAREYNEGTTNLNDHLRAYPDNTVTFREKLASEFYLPKKYSDKVPTSSSSSHYSSTRIPETHYLDVPLLSFLVALFAQFFDHNYYLTGTLLIPVLASLFILPLGIYFFRIGVPIAGLLGGLIGTFAGGYYMRSSIGRIDTDMLNLFFPALAGLLILLASKTKSERYILLYSTGTGLSLFFFQWWYNRAGFTLAFFMLLVFILFVKRIQLRTILLSSLLFVFCVQPTNIMKSSGEIQEFIKKYYVISEVKEELIENEIKPATFLNTITTISEAGHVSIDEVFRRILSKPILGWVGFLSFILMAMLCWRVLLPLAPMLALGLLSFQSSNRFIMYLGPFIGIGLGWLLSLGIEGFFSLLTRNFTEVKGEEGTVIRERVKFSLWTRILLFANIDQENMEKIRLEAKGYEDTKKNSHRDTRSSGNLWWNWSRQGVLYFGLGLFFWLISAQTAISFVPRPSIHTGLYATFLEVKKLVSKDSALLTWWDYGYAITDATGLATFHDGGSQQSPKTYFTARGLVSSDPKELYDITQFLATEGNKGIAENNTSSEALLLAVRNPKRKPLDPIYLFFTADMTGKYGAISRIGSWDLRKGGSQPIGYQNLACHKITNQEINCRGVKIDLKTGKINNQIPLKRLIFIRDGQVLREQKFGHVQGYTLQLLVEGKKIVQVQLIGDAVFHSNYNQMFLLGRYREDLFEETYNSFPFSRLFRVKF